MSDAVRRIELRWKMWGDRSLYCECKPSPDWPCWSYLGSVCYFPGNWLTRWLYPKRYAAIVMQGKDAMCRSLEEAKQWVEDNAVWP